MSALVPDKLSLLDRAAELRAAGTSLPVAAERLKLTTDELRALIGSNRRDFQRLSRRAEREFDAELRRVALAKLLELMRSNNEAAAMFAAGTVIRYELARMRAETRRRREAAYPPRNRLRDESPPPPSRGVTLTPHPRDSGCDSPLPPPQLHIQKPVMPQAPPSSLETCDIFAAAATTARAHEAPSPQSAAFAQAVGPKGKSTMVDAIRKKKWLPPGLSR
jgi:hypothetical protein